MMWDVAEWFRDSSLEDLAACSPTGFVQQAHSDGVRLIGGEDAVAHYLTARG